MKKIILFFLLTFLIIQFSLLPTRETFAQENQKENKMDTASSVTAMPDKTSSYVTGITTERAKSLVGGLMSLISIIIGGVALSRSKRHIGRGRNGAIVALLLGLIGIVLSIVHLSTSAGAVFGSGSGKAGAIFGLVLGLIGMTLGGLTLARSRRKNHTT